VTLALRVRDWVREDDEKRIEEKREKTKREKTS
jgi:hypothetical protein